MYYNKDQLEKDIYNIVDTFGENYVLRYGPVILRTRPVYEITYLSQKVDLDALRTDSALGIMIMTKAMEAENYKYSQ